MPTVELNKKDLLHFIGKDLSDDVLKDRIPMIGTDVDEVNKESVIVEIFPDRPDMLCEEGLGRAMQGFLDVKKGLVKYDVKKGQYKIIVDKEMENIKPFVGFAVLKGVKFTDSFIKSHMQLQDKLSTTHCRRRKKAGMGVYDLSKIKFPIKFKSIGPDDKFTPLLFDKEMRVKEIIEEHAKGKEYAHLVKDLKRYPAFVDADGKIMGMPPITQADFSKVTENTKDILVEVTGEDWKVMIQLLNILVCNWVARGAEIYSVQIEFPYKTPAGQNVVTPNLEPSKMDLKIDEANKLLGLDLKGKEIMELLEKMRYSATVHGNKISVEVPAYRTDVLHAADLIEDVAIAYGYENFEAEIPKVATISEEHPKSLFAKKVAETAVGLGLLECVNYHLSNCDVLFKKMNLKEENVVKAINAVNIEYDTVRNAFIPMLMKVLGENKHYEYPQKLFEMGEVLSAKGNDIVENLNFAIVSAHTGADFTEIRSMTEALLEAIGYKPEFKPIKHPSFIDGRVSEINVKGKVVGVLGEIHPQVLNNFEVEQSTAAMEINLDLLL
jgi:phenylalanyl-tRNA synthetase beta chain